MMQTKKNNQLFDTSFDSNVNSVRLGRKHAKLFVTGTENGKLKLSNLKSSKNAQLMEFDAGSSIVKATFDNREDLLLASTSNGSLKIWDLYSQQVCRTWEEGADSIVNQIEFHPFADVFITASGSNIRLYDLKSKEIVHIFKGHSKSITSLRFSPDGKTFASGSLDGSVRFWDLTTGKQVWEWTQADSIHTIEFHPTELILFASVSNSSTSQHQIHAFNLDGVVIASSSIENSAMKHIVFTSDGINLVSIASDSVKIWSQTQLQCLDSQPNGAREIRDVNLFEDKLFVASSSLTNTTNLSVMLVDVRKMKPYASENEPPTQQQQQSSIQVSNGFEIHSQPTQAQQTSQPQPQQQQTTKQANKKKPLGESNTNASTTTKQSNNSTNSNNTLQSSNSRQSILPTMDTSPATSPLAEEIMADHHKMTALFSSRETNIKMIRPIWSRGDIVKAFEMVSTFKDEALLSHLLTIANSSKKKDLFSFEMSATLLPILSDLCSSPIEEFSIVAIQVVQSFVQLFTNSFKANKIHSNQSILVEMRGKLSTRINSKEEKISPKYIRVASDFLQTLKTVLSD